MLLAWVTTFSLGIYRFDLLPESAQLASIGRGSLAGQAPPSVPVEVTCEGEPLAGSALLPGAANAPAMAYLRIWPDSSVAALSRHCDGLARVLAEWLEIDPSQQAVRWLDETGSDGALRDLLQDRPAVGLDLVALLPLPSPLSPDATVLEDASARQRIVLALREKVASGPVTGLCLYPYGNADRHLEGLRALFVELKAALPGGLRTCLVAEAESLLWRDADLVRAVDHVVLQAFRNPMAGEPPGALAPQHWFDALVQDARASVGPEKLHLALGSFGYLWRAGVDRPVPVSFAEAMRLAARHPSQIALDPASLNTRIDFTDTAGRAGVIWLLDAVSLHNQLLALASREPAALVLWSAGLEDPGAWRLLRKLPEPPRAAELEAVSFRDVVGYEGEGPFRRIVQEAAEGRRTFFHDPATGLITGEVYASIPRPFTVERYGRLDRKVVALTFDDGPDPEYTSAILDALEAERVPATFFLIGANVIRHPDIVRRMIDGGHEVGSHTLFHPRDEALGPERIQLELNAAQRMLASISGRTTYLFRTPYGRSEGPLTAAEARPQKLIEEEGYLIVGADITPRDWEDMTAEEIVVDVMEGTTGEGGQVIVLHDAGGDRSATVAAIPLLIGRLRAEGYDFVPLSAFLGVARDEVMPFAHDRFSLLDGPTFAVIVGFGRLVNVLFWMAIFFGTARSLVVLMLALLRRPHRVQSFEPPVTVAIPAFNEELVVADAIAAALGSDYPGLRVIVIDDGSTDGTSAVVRGRFGDDPRVRLIRQENAGKWAALNAAYRQVGTEIVVAIDADTVLEPDAIRLMARHFADPEVGAVAGNVKVDNRTGLLPRLQALEYITAQNIDRRALERLNAVLVVPGAIGAWRVAAVRRAGLYSPATITEDADLTVAVRRAGYRVVFEERAFSRTEVPDTVAAFMSQRLRWTFGMMQTAWRHGRSWRSAPGIGLFAIPDLWLTGVTLGLLAPVADLVFLGVAVDAVMGLVLGRPSLVGDVSGPMLAGWLVLPLIDLVAALAAFGFERTERWSLVLLVPLQRLFYRPLLYLTVYRAVGRALAGHIASWGKLVRHRGATSGPVR